MRKELKDKLSTLTTKSGCYLMKDRDGKVIYVGKAINLRNRVNSYFKGAHDFKTTKLVSNIYDFDYIVTGSEKEALILEYNLIKEYDPRYNIIFKDDKSYPYILLSYDEEPYIRSIRISKKTRYKGRIFGPYPDIGAANNTVNLINKIFPTRKCKNMPKDVCLYYHMGQCPGYCKGDVDLKTKRDVKLQIERFLKGDNTEVIKDLKAKMEDASMSMNFEKAMEYRDLINDINYVTASKQTVQKNSRESFDTFGYYAEDGYISIVGLFIRDGKLLFNNLYMDQLYGDAEEEFISYIYQFYSNHLLPKELILDDNIDSSLLSQTLGLNISSYKKGFRKEMLKKAYENARVNLEQKKTIIKKDGLYYEMIENEFRKLFDYVPERIEIFDNSHIGGELTCAGMVVYENLKPNRKEYRLYKLEDSADDLKSMKEVLYRRYFRVLKDDLKRPDLIIVDGAINQINVAREIIESLGLDIRIAGLGKDDKHNTSYMMDENGNLIDIDPKSNFFMFLASMQDEVHRFAITFNRKLRKKKTYVSKLDGIKGLGDKRRTALLRKYKSVSGISALSLEELSQDLPKDVAMRVYNKLRGEDDAGNVE